MQISCCLNGLSLVSEFVDFDFELNYGGVVLPSGCTSAVCDTTVGGAALIIAMPLAVVMSLFLALVAVL